MASNVYIYYVIFVSLLREFLFISNFMTDFLFSFEVFMFIWFYNPFIELTKVVLWFHSLAKRYAYFKSK